MVYFDLLRSFTVFAEKLNFTHAAQELHLSQPALHAQIQKLSEHLGVALYRRTGRSLTLTAQGQQVLSFARELSERSHSFAQELRGQKSNQPVILAAGEGAYLYVLGDAIGSFVKKSKAPLRLLTRNVEQTVAALLSGEAHLGVSAIDATPEGLSADLIESYPQILVMPKEHPLSKKRKVELQDIEGQSLVLPQADRPHRTAISRALLSVGVTAHVNVEANGWAMMMHFVKLGLGVSIVNGCCHIPPGLVARPIEELPKVHYQLLRKTERQLPLAAKELQQKILTKK